MKESETDGEKIIGGEKEKKKGGSKRYVCVRVCLCVRLCVCVRERKKERERERERESRVEGKVSQFTIFPHVAMACYSCS